ncbi:hypothetical protein GC087_17425 [Pantoea sp. JZ2]|uniref:endonuclease/exonuclease/phosphatase family protein n=1 Tax=Pantoea sp. JZ2 TaxID=2654189 RepID=UPI002B478240|nr:hypothetical protein [Pantoea sp. JZ2]WRH14255.1 hypothetical protein GC087_17425 [Pantoea sp. JZ2]
MDDLISVAWWNTGLSPAVNRDRASDGSFELAVLIIAKMISDYNLDIICLGEISPKEIEKLKSCFYEIGYSVYDGTYNEGRIKHDLCALIKTEKFILISTKSITEQSLLGSIRAGQELHLMHVNSQDSFFLYISHWPSRNYDNAEGMPQRNDLGKSLRQAIDRCKEEMNGEYFILVGDYNDEPFNYSLTHALYATRDIGIVLKDIGFFYNPFWRHLGAKVSYSNDENQSKTYGTYYYKSGKVTKWHTFDQIMFSSSFLKGGKWSLLEDTVRIVNDDNISNLILNGENKFDHLPVVASVKRV